jgi:hypothetical protein
MVKEIIEKKLFITICEIKTNASYLVLASSLAILHFHFGRIIAVIVALPFLPLLLRRLPQRVRFDLLLRLAHSLDPSLLPIQTPNLDVGLGQCDCLRQNLLHVQILQLKPFAGALRRTSY